jgi:hypothetical protein
MPMSNDQNDTTDQEFVIGGNGIFTLPEDMTQEEADRLVEEADAAQAERTRRFEAGEEID